MELRILDDRASWLLGRAENVTSQFGEDGLIAAALDRFGVQNRWCFEVGANAGVDLSNTHTLRLKGWNAVLIEAEDGHYQKLLQCAGPNVHCIQERIGPESLDRILSACGAPLDLDFGCIDIDGQDYWCWKGMIAYRPRLMLVEYARGKEWQVPDCGASEGQATLEPVVQLGKDKGYDALAATYCNVLFVRNDLWATMAA